MPARPKVLVFEHMPKVDAGIFCRLLSEHGLEWLGRLLIEPGRLWRRYLLGLPQFGWRVIRHRLLR